MEILEPSPERIAPLAEHPGVPWQVLPYERQLVVKHAQVDDALTADRPARRVRAGGDRARAWSSGATATSSSTPSGRSMRAAGWCAASTPRAGERRACADRGLSAGIRARQPRARGVAGGRRAGLTAWERGRAGGPRTRPSDGAAADGRVPCATWSCAKVGARASCRFASSRPRGELEAGALARSLSEARREPPGVLWTRSRSLAETTAGGETELVWGDAELPPGAPRRLDLRISPEAFFQTNTEMAELLYGLASSTRRWRAGSASTTSTAGSARSR